MKEKLALLYSDTNDKWLAALYLLTLIVYW